MKSQILDKIMPLLILILVTLTASGCMRRRMTITSDPPGAMVYVDDYAIGQTPVSHNFTYYGTRNFRLEMDGYETVNEQKEIKSPWYEVPPLDFVTDNLTPCEVKDNREFNFVMQPQKAESEEDVVSRGAQLRDQQAAIPGNTGLTGAYNSADPYSAAPTGQTYPNSDSEYIGAEPGMLPAPRSTNDAPAQEYNYGTPTTIIE